jgi:hypothetical protein
VKRGEDVGGEGWVGLKPRGILGAEIIGEEGGETELCIDLKIKPEKGKLLIFPASWLYPHSGKMPISNDKYIVTGWIYAPYDL